MGISTATCRRALTTVAESDPRIARALEVVGFPPGRSRPHEFATFVRIIVGQQVSTRAAAAIYARLEEKLRGDVSPGKLLRVRETTLRAAGLSGRKVEYARGLAKAVRDGELDLHAMKRQSDEEVIEAITRLRGFGVWSAQMVLMFSLGRRDVWPVDDLGVQSGVQYMLELPVRPRGKALHPLAEPWRPHRSSVALLAWHYIHNAPV